jgi:uncharacterized protein
MTIMKQLVYPLLLLLLCSSARAQNLSDSLQKQTILMQDAAKYLRGNGKPYNPEKAFALYLKCAQQGNAKAMNAVAILYNQGLGVGVNLEEALSWFQRAANTGYAAAWNNLGNMYKNGDVIQQDFSKAYYCYSQAAKNNDLSGLKHQAYMLYKGLGCKQDYSLAFSLYQRCALRGSANSMYFLGLCFRNGYGVARNLDSARYYLQLAASKGDEQAKQELSLKDPENPLVPLNAPSLTQTTTAKTLQGSYNFASSRYKRIRHNLPASDLPGTYSGYALKYDWSGTHVVSISRLHLKLEQKGGELTGVWTEDDSLSAGITATLTDSALLFTNTRYSRLYHYSPNKPELFEFKNAQLQLVKTVDSVYLAGNLQLYSPNRKEHAKPFYVLLTKVVEGENSSLQQKFNKANITQLKTYPNPFTSSINISFIIHESSRISLSVVDMDGRTIYSEASEQLLPGQYQRNLKIQGAPGMYVIKLMDGTSSVSSMIVKQ